MVSFAQLKRAYKDFVNEYGTHYMKSAILGSKLIFYKGFNNRSSDYGQEKGRQNCVEGSVNKALGGGIAGILSLLASFSPASNRCSGCSTHTSSGSSNSQTLQGIITIGTVPTTSLETWAKRATGNPVPVQFELEKISSLFRDKWLNSIEVDPRSPNNEKLHAPLLYIFFEEMSSYYCWIMTNGNSCEYNLKGCGLNSDCPYGTTCINDNENLLGYRCQKSIKYGQFCVSKREYL